MNDDHKHTEHEEGHEHHEEHDEHEESGNGHEKEAQDAQEKNVDYKESFVRAQADYQNLLKETEKKRKEWVEFANLGLLTDLIPVIEHFYQGLKYVPEEQKKENWFVGFAQIKKQLDEFADTNGLKRMEVIDKLFDPQMHEAVGQRQEEGKKPGMILEEIMGGYTLHGKVIQPAKVIINE